jgi:Family of unknown function (DUF6498)
VSRSAIAALILANLLVAVQAVRGGWGYYETLLIYWCEALIIGGYNVVRLLLVGVLGREPLGATIGQWVDLGGESFFRTPLDCGLGRTARRRAGKVTKIQRFTGEFDDGGGVTAV